jgi:hypothetical protein
MHIFDIDELDPWQCPHNEQVSRGMMSRFGEGQFGENVCIDSDIVRQQWVRFRTQSYAIHLHLEEAAQFSNKF